MQEAAAELDTLSLEGETPEPKKKAAAKEKAVEPPKPDDETPAPGEAPDETPAPPPEPTKINDLRTAYSTLKKKVAEEYEPKIKELQTLQARVKELEGSNPPEVSILQEKLSAAEKRRDELEAQIVYVDYSKSKEFHEKFQKPYLEAWQQANADLAELTVENPDGTSRTATQDDLAELANMRLGEARKLANARFGDSADDVMAHRQKIIDLARAQEKALDEAKEKAVEKARLTESEQKTQTAEAGAKFQAANDQIVKKWPKMFGKIDGDAEGNTLLEKGLAMADKLFIKEQQPKTIDEQVQLHALIRQKVANHDRLALWLKKARTQIKELEESLKQYENSDPNGGLGGGSTTPDHGTFLDDANAEIDKLAKER